MRTTIDISELQNYAFCPEFARRTPGPLGALKNEELTYRRNLRTVLVRFYTALADERMLTEAELRRLWSTLWEIPIQSLQNRSFSKAHAATFNGLMTSDERMLLRGTKVLNGLCSRRLNAKMTPIIVDEPFSFTLEGLTLTGRFDLVFEDDHGAYWIVDWTNEPTRIASAHYFKHTLLAEGFRTQTGRSAGVLVDYLFTLGNVLEASPRDAAETARQMAEAAALAKSLSLDLTYRRIGSWCTQCPYKPDCFGVKHVATPSARARPRKHALPTSLKD